MPVNDDARHRRGLRFRNRIWVICGAPALAAAGVAAPSIALAQPLRPAIELEARAQWDSNVTRASKALTPVNGLEPGDIRYTLSGTVDTSRRIGRQQAFVQGSVAYDFYQKNKSLERWRADLRTGLSGRLGPCSGGVNGAYTRSLAELSPISPTDPANSIENIYGYGASTSCPLFGPIGATVAVQQRHVRTTGSLNQTGSNSTTVSTSVGYISRGFGSLSVIGSYATSEYMRPPRPIAFAPSGVETYSIGLQYSRPIGSRMTGSANVSYFELSRDDGPLNEAITGRGTSGTTWGVNFTYRASSRFSMNASYADSVSATTRIGSAYQNEKRATFGARYRANDRLVFSANASHSDRDFSGVNLLGIATKEQRIGYGVGLRYELRDNINIALDAGRADLDTDQALSNYTSQRASVSIVATF